MFLILLLIFIDYKPPVTDYAFQYAQEEFVRDATKLNRLETVLTEFDARLIRLLGSDDYDARSLAQDIILEIINKDIYEGNYSSNCFFIPLAWGTWHKKASVRRACQGLISKIVCSNCSGTGFCSFCLGTRCIFIDNINCFTGTCLHCCGTGRPSL